MPMLRPPPLPPASAEEESFLVDFPAAAVMEEVVAEVDATLSGARAEVDAIF